MELSEVMIGMDWQRALFVMLLGGGMTGMFWLVTSNPWPGVFLTACTTMWFLAEARDMRIECEGRKEEVAELERHVVALKTVIHEMAVQEAKHSLRRGAGPFSSSNSL
jgi:hypothetical protein